MLQRNMGDSSACVMQPFCYASGFSNESNSKSSPMDALEQSVSFGRFTSESLAWEKWSTFSSQNRYVEEAERISRPGSVAQKKAFFEAHYKKLADKKAAAALLEKANSTSQTQQEHDEAGADNTKYSQITFPKSKLVVNEKNAASSNIDTSFPQRENHNVERAQPKKEHQTSERNSMQNQLEDVEKQGSNFDDHIGKSKFTAPIISDRENIAAAFQNNSKSSFRTKRPTAKSLHMSIKFLVIREIKRLTTSVMTKLENTRVSSAGSSKASRDSLTTLTTPTKASKNELQKHPSFSPSTEKKRNNMRSPIIYSPFGLRTEKRAGSRKKKLGKKFITSETQKVQLHMKHKEKTDLKFRKLRQCLCFKARPPPEFDNEIEEAKRGTKARGFSDTT